MIQKLMSVEGLVVRFFTRKGTVRAVDGVSFDVDDGSIIGLVGESGCGKSATALSIMGLLGPAGKAISGSVYFEGEDLLRLSPKEVRQIRGKEISMVFQEPMSALNPVRSVGEQVAEPLKIHVGLSGGEARLRAIEVLEEVGIPDAASRYDQYPHQFSGGMGQRAMIAMALICEPKLLIADEPTTALDVTIQAQIISLLHSLRERLHMAVLLITHDFGVVAELCDAVNVMYAGVIVEQGNVVDIFDDPLHPYTRGLLRSMPRAKGKQRKLEAIGGAVPSLIELPQGCRFHPRCKHATERCLSEEPPIFQVDEDRFTRCWLFEGQMKS
jgi:oligopeptide/dipeptide ABC transporter ATP-binding protein